MINGECGDIEPIIWELIGIEVFLDEWQQAAEIMIEDEAAGHIGASRLEYDIDYFANRAAVDALKGLIVDCRAVSVNASVDIGSRQFRRWPPFLLDLMPQGHARRQLSRQVAEMEGGVSNPTRDTLERVGRIFGFILGFVPKAPRSE